MTDADKAKAIEEGLAIAELKRQAGYNILVAKIDQRIKRAVAELRRIELQGRSLQDIGAEYVSQVKLIDGLNEVFTIIEDIESRKSEAEEDNG